MKKSSTVMQWYEIPFGQSFSLEDLRDDVQCKKGNSVTTKTSKSDGNCERGDFVSGTFGEQLCACLKKFNKIPSNFVDTCSLIIGTGTG